MNTFKERTKELCAQNGIQLKYIHQKLGRGSTYLNDAWRGKASLSDSEYRVVADILNTTPEYLRGETDDPMDKEAELMRVLHAKGALYYDANSTPDELRIASHAQAIHQNLIGDVQKAEIVRKFSSADVNILKKLDKLMDMLLDEK